MPDEPIKVSFSGGAVSRVTKTPISFNDVSLKAAQNMLKALQAEGVKAYIEGNQQPEYSSGEYFVKNKNISVNIGDLNNSYADIQRTIHHEDTHAAIEKNGVLNRVPQLDHELPVPWYNNFLMPIGSLIRSFNQGRRAGEPTFELPAYTNTYSPDDLPGTSQAAVDAYRQDLLQKMPPNVVTLLNKIHQNYLASQNFAQQQGIK